MKSWSCLVFVSLLVGCAKPVAPETPVPPTDELQEEDSAAATETEESQDVDVDEANLVEESPEEMDAFTKEEQEIRARELEEKKERDAQTALNDSVHGVAKNLWGVTPQNIEGTIADIERLEEQYPDKLMIGYNKGVALYKQEKKGDAKKQFLALTKKDPSYALPWYALGQLALERKDYRDALRSYERGLSNNPKRSFQLRAAKVDVLRRMGRFDEAKAEAKLALKENGNNIGVYQSLIDLHLEKGEVDTAEFMVSMANRRLGTQGTKQEDGTNKAAEDHRIITSEAYIKYRQYGPNEFTKQRLLYSLSLQPNQHLARVVLGICFLADHAWNEAKKHLELAYRVEPENPTILNALAIAYRGEEKYEKSEELYRAALKKTKSPEIELNLGLAIGFQFKQNMEEKPTKEQVEEAQKELEKQKKEVDDYIQRYERSENKDENVLKDVRLVVSTLYNSEKNRLLFMMPDDEDPDDMDSDDMDSDDEDSDDMDSDDMDSDDMDSDDMDSDDEDSDDEDSDDMDSVDDEDSIEEDPEDSEDPAEEDDIEDEEESTEDSDDEVDESPNEDDEDSDSDDEESTEEDSGDEVGETPNVDDEDSDEMDSDDMDPADDEDSIEEDPEDSEDPAEEDDIEDEEESTEDSDDEVDESPNEDDEDSDSDDEESTEEDSGDEVDETPNVDEEDSDPAEDDDVEAVEETTVPKESSDNDSDTEDSAEVDPAEEDDIEDEEEDEEE